MNWYQTVFELIDMRSFSNLWYWIALAVLWSTASHWVLGVPFDMVVRARRHGGQTAQDLEYLVGINVRRLLFIGGVSGLWMVAFSTTILTSLALLGFWYGVEFAQALLLLLFPMTLVGLMSLRTARRIAREGAAGPDLWKRLTRHRMGVQAIGMLSILVTAMWGMWQNIQIGPM
ncbi:MAG TPA: component of SufBCD complex [Paracoccaceae bacterium]|nr:component of SufBCD complex [Paracoccaceae bacterium]